MLFDLKPKLSAFYYPYADIKPTKEILLASLLFDEIYFLERDFFRSPLERDNFDSETNFNLSNYNFFKEIGHQIIGINREGKPVLNEISKYEIQNSITKDINDKNLQELTKKYDKKHWLLPNGQFMYWNGIGLLLNNNHPDLFNFRPELITDRVDFYDNYLKSHNYTYEIKSFEESRIRNPKKGIMVRIPFLLAESLMINIVLHACRELGLTPITDSNIHDEFLRVKLNNLSNSLLNEKEINNLDISLKYSDIGSNSINLSVPNLENLTFDKVANLRDECKDELDLFRSEMLLLSSQIENYVWHKDYQQELQKTYLIKVEAPLKDLENKLKSLQKKFAFNLITKGTLYAPVPALAVKIFAGIPIEIILPATIGASVLSEYIAHRIQKNEIKKNGLGFLLKI